ncbi:MULTISPECIES: XRE family transcriptional regulator [Staphylococcus]|uniref:helix-turn-helix domain-containing protein n=1 Tax=Staphylococcus TaxID=1279 RepID=UPI0007642F08|nr:MULTISPECIES: XRE family transcriptional regulator [Staphylococcus]KXA44538.1 peptidase S24-like protein [Staphylococcus simulans]MBO0386230.1 LexA family transcriptional regulator [Staphylococcus simulans]OFM14814.1 peptidase S24 [Staphylococcus sp. HMSC059E03]OFN19830.1 peptidase S24 [Staphylococcus sp. HMSC055C03]OFU77305.1 peptidase S24 [Staphylococcus sp. HMSC10C03]
MEKEKHLKHLMELKSGSVKAFSTEIGLAYTTVRSILERGVFNAKVENVIKICKGLNIKPESLMEIDDTIISESITKIIQLTPPRQHNVLDFANKQLEEQNNEVSENDRNIITIKRMHAAAAGVVGEELFDDLIEEDVEFYEDEVPKGADFCILVNGDSMEPMIKEGTYAFIKRETNIKDGTIALVVLDGTSFIKRVDIHPEYLKLISLNPKYEDITVSSFNDLKVVGKIVL